MKETLSILAVVCSFFATLSFACERDADCAHNQICNTAGQCVHDGRPDNVLKTPQAGEAVIENVTPAEAQFLPIEAAQVMMNGHIAVEPKGGAITKEKAAAPLVNAFQNHDLRACGMVWHRDERRPAGLYSVWRPTKPVAIIVNLTRNGRLVGATHFAIRPPNQEISLLINQNGRDHDGVRSCVVTL